MCNVRNILKIDYSATVRTWHETGQPQHAAAVSNGRGNGL